MMKRKRLAVITTHPIQYNAPLFKLLAQKDNIELKVFYTWGKSVVEKKYDPGFEKNITWDIPLLEGYEYEFLENTSSDKGTHHFKGIINPGIIKRIDDFSADALLVYGWSFYSHLKIMRHYKKSKAIIFRGDSTLLNKQTFYKRFARTIFLRWIYRHVDYALYVGKNNYNYYKKMGLREEQLVYAPHAIDNDRFSKNEETDIQNAFALKKDFLISEKDIVFLFVGKLEDEKDPETFFSAFMEANMPSTTKLIIVGAGKYEKELREKYGKISSVIFLGFQNQSQMPTIYHLADVFVLPSKSETWGLAVNEAMVCGLPILISDKCGCAPDLVANNENGFVFESGNVDDLSAKFEMLARLGKSRLKEMGDCSRIKIRNFSFETICEATENLLSKIE